MSGLNVEQFVASTARSILGKLAGNFITQFTNSSLGETLASLGNTYETIQNLGTISADNVLNGVAKSYFNSTGLNRVFGRINLNPNEYASQIRPETKINQNAKGALVFPADLGPYYMSLHFKKYKRPAPFVDGETEIAKSIYLPIPRELLEGHSVEWDTFRGDIIGGAADVMQWKAAGGKDATSKAMSLVGSAAVGKAVESVGSFVSTTLGVGDIGKTVEQSIGGSINPNLSVAFGGPQLRENLNFTWEFNPNNFDESSDLKNILNEIKMRSLPALAVEGSAQFLAYPHIVECRIHAGSDDDLILYKQAVVTNVSINYSPNGIPSFFKGTREPTFIGLSLTLKEIEYFLSEDFGGKSGELQGDIATRLNETAEAIENVVPGAKAIFDNINTPLNDLIGM
jgi:hypothetical protein